MLKSNVKSKFCANKSQKRQNLIPPNLPPHKVATLKTSRVKTRNLIKKQQKG